MIDENIPDGVRLFKLFFSKERDNYFLKDLGEGSGVFVKTEKRTKLHQGAIISFGQHHLVINYKLSKEVDHDKKINIQVIDGEKIMGL